ncbi:MAG: ribonuclease P protein component [Planctomycetales bacterium]|nr:ribonuclease P protein component [Planctomycetales bacterium]
MKGFGLPGTARIRRKRDFASVMGQGRRFGDPLLAAKVLGNRLGQTRLGLAVRRGKGGAVERNRVKRLLREAFRLSLPELPSGYDVVLMPQGVTGRTPLAELSRSLRALLARAAADPRVRAAGAAGPAGPVGEGP